MDKLHILFVEDDEQLAKLTRNALINHDFRVEVAHCAHRMWQVLSTKAVDMLILDLELPDGHGIPLLDELAQKGHNIPIIITSAHSAEKTRVTCLRKGADDYMSKPYGFFELVSRIEAVFRRVEPYVKRAENQEEVADEIMRFGPNTFNVTRKKVIRGNRDYELTEVETRLLQFFLDNPERLLPREEIYREVYQVEWNPNDRRLDRNLASLRNKIEPDLDNQKYIVNVRGTGYLFYPEGQPE